MAIALELPREYAQLLGMRVQDRQDSLSIQSIQRITNSANSITKNTSSVCNASGIVRYVGHLWAKTIDGWEPVLKAGVASWWIGVEWNDVKRGKHVGPKSLPLGFQQTSLVSAETEEKYFYIHEGKSASMMRLEGAGIDEALETLSLNLAVDVDTALHRAYWTVKHEEHKWAGKLVEFVGFDQVQSKLSHIDELRELDLRACSIDRHGMQCYPEARRLDLARNLIADADCLKRILDQFPNVEQLGLGWMDIDWSGWNGNVLSRNVQVLSMFGLSNLDMLRHLTTAFPNLQRLSLNQSTGVQAALQGFTFANLTHLDISDCGLNVIPSMTLPSLTELNVSRNQVKSLGALQPLPATEVNLSDNELSWMEYSSITHAFPCVRSLKCRRNPLDPKAILSLSATTDSDSRSLLIALLPSTITELNGSVVDERERLDAELWYLARMSKLSEGMQPNVLIKAHARLSELVQLHMQQNLDTWIRGQEMKRESDVLTLTIRHGQLETTVTCRPATPFRKVLSLGMTQLQLSTPVFKLQVNIGGQPVNRNDFGKDISRVMDEVRIITIA